MDCNYLFATLFNIDVTALPRLDEPAEERIIDILKYDLPMRKVFYKFYPQLLSENPKLENYFSSKDLERSLIADQELIYIPIDLIDPNVIQTKVFDKLLSQDYDIIQEYINVRKGDPGEPCWYLARKIEYEIHYNNILIPELNKRINNNLEFYAELLGGFWVIDAVPNALDTLSDKYIIEYLNSHAHKDISRRCGSSIINTRYCLDNTYVSTLWDNLTDSGKINLLSIHLHNPIYKCILPNNSIATLHTTIEFISSFVKRKVQLCQNLIDFFEFNITNDAYTGDWVILDPSDANYKHVVVDNISCKLNEDGVKIQLRFDQMKSVGYHVANYINFKYNEVYCNTYSQANAKLALVSTIILEEVIQYFPMTIRVFDIHNNDVRKMLLTKCNIENLSSVFHNELTVDEAGDLLNKIITDKSYHNNSYLTMFKLNDAHTMNTIIEATNRSNDFDIFVSKNLRLFINAKQDEHVDITESFLTYYINKATTSEQLFALISSINMTDDILHKIFQVKPNFVYNYLDSRIQRHKYDEQQFVQLIDQYMKGRTNELYNLGIRYIAEYHAEPLLVMYPPPNFVSTNTTNANTATAWSKYVNRSTVPKEMTNTSFYEYMIKCNGIKKNPEFTSCYSFFSNSLENKIIFVKADTILDLPAVLRFDIPVVYERVKNYLLEGIETNNITMFTTITDNDWNKISGGNNMIDCVALSDSKNIYRERTPLREVISYLIKAVEIEFNIKAIVPEVA